MKLIIHKQVSLHASQVSTGLFALPSMVVHDPILQLFFCLMVGRAKAREAKTSKSILVVKKLTKDLSTFDKNKRWVNVIVETPKGSRIKYAYDFDSDFFVIRKVLPAGMAFPFNFGFVPQTLAQDGDPLDMLILNEEPIVCGCLLKVRSIGVIKASQIEGGKAVRNDRILGQAISKEGPIEFQALKLNSEVVGQIETFFVNYNQFYGKKFKVLGFAGPPEAKRLIGKAVALFQRGWGLKHQN
jgi:inorganic pyrophosphatase